MSWIKENKFIAGLAGGTLLGVIVLYVVGSQGSSRYAAAQERYQAASDEVVGFEKSALYPKIDYRDAKRKALDDYRKSVDTVQQAFTPFRPQEIKNISPQEFTAKLLEANAETRKAFEDAGTLVPEPYFVGFENYKTSLAPGNTTGILDYQLNAVKNLMLDLAKAKPTELKNLHRPPLVEETGQTFTAAPADAARPFPLEITFTGTEKSAREFISSIVDAKTKYAVIRSVRILNEKKDPPRSTDAKFDEATASSASAPAASSESAGFVFPGDEAAVPAATPAEAPAAVAPASSSSRILSQVLGSEQVQVFVRLDVLQFLPVKKLP